MFQLKKQGTLITSGLHILSVKISPAYTTELELIAGSIHLIAYMPSCNGIS
jgi:hypothetical protein